MIKMSIPKVPIIDYISGKKKSSWKVGDVFWTPDGVKGKVIKKLKSGKYKVKYSDVDKPVTEDLSHYPLSYRVK